MMSSEKLTILVADDHPMFRSGLVQMLNSQQQIEKIIECENGKEALEKLRSHKFDLAILDVDMPLMSGLDVLRSVSSEEIDVKVIILTMYNDESIVNHAIDNGARGFVLKASAIQEIQKCITTVLNDSIFYSAELTPYLYRRSHAGSGKAKSASSIDDLSPSELRVLRLIAGQISTKEIAEQLMVSPKTIENHRANICKKLNVHGTNALVKFALANKDKL